MMTQFDEVIQSFHSSFMDKVEIPHDLENFWLKKAIAEYGTEIAPLDYNEELGEFSESLNQYVIDTLATMIKVYYIERCVSKYNKIASIVGKDLSLNGNNGLQKYNKDELESTKSDLRNKLFNLKPTAYN